MPMQMGFRWYGEGNDKISLQDIRQIPGVSTIVWALHNKMPGEIWEPEEIEEVRKQIEAYGFNMDVVESVNVHDDHAVPKTFAYFREQPLHLRSCGNSLTADDLTKYFCHCKPGT